MKKALDSEKKISQKEKSPSQETHTHTQGQCCKDRVRSLDGWSWLRILMAAGLVIGAYYWGISVGVRHAEKQYEYQSRNEKYSMHDMMKENRESRMREDTPSSQTMGTKSLTHDAMDMSMRDMGQMLVGKSGDVLDRAFLEGMIPHHQGAVDMAKYLVNAKHPELQKMGTDIIKAQTSEIEQMKKWMQEWGYTATGTMAHTGAMMHMMPDGTMMHGGM